MTDTAATPAQRDGEQRCKIIAAAERLFREIGYQKTTVADIARALKMSPANVYRFFSAKSEINQAVARQMMREVEEALRRIALGPGPATERLRALVTTNEAMNAARYVRDRKLHEMVEAALNENWPIIAEHIQNIDESLEIVIASGVQSGEFAPREPKLGARLVHTACIRYCHPRLMVECADHPAPTSGQMIDFCLAALKK
jgi:AcrR family transcriptional regulator